MDSQPAAPTAWRLLATELCVRVIINQDVLKMSLKRKKEILSSLKEVEDLHPLLQKLFVKFPHVKHVDYTHGVYEKGADFILTVENEIFGDNEYIGVIVKTSKITQGFTEIYDQIDDCDSERYSLNGKKKITLDEIWILTSKTISQNAQDTINRKFRNRKIKFLQQKDLINFIDRFLSNYWTSIPLNISEYLYELQSNIKKIDKAFSLLPANIEPFYIDLYLQRIFSNYDIKQLKKNQNKVKDLLGLIYEHDIILIEGGPGVGKSQLLRKTILELTSSEKFIDNKILPVLVSYYEFSKRYDLNIATLLKEKLYKCKKEIEDDHEIIILICIDGFDESFSTERDYRNELLTLFEQIKGTNRTKLIITTRPLNFIDYNEILPDPRSAYEVSPLTYNQIINFFQKICSSVNISHRLFDDIKRSAIFKQLPRNPIAAILLAQLIKENAKDLPSNLTDVYLKYSELMLGRWDIQKGLQKQKEFEATINIVSIIAKYFIENNLTALSVDEAKEFFKEYLEVRNLEIDYLKLFDRVIERSGILQIDLQQNIVFFKHRSFVEFFYAFYKFKHLDKSFIDKRALSLQWKNIYFFYIGLHKDCEEILREILALPIESEEEKFTKVINMADYYLAAFTTPYKIVESSLSNLVKDFTDVYFAIITNKLDTLLNNLPEMLILEFFQVLFRQSYSYEFFLKALEASIIDLITDDKIDNEYKAYALFFISVVFRDLEKENPFDGLIQELQNSLPLPIKFGLLYEAKHIPHQSKLLRKIEKKIMRELRKNPSLREYAKQLHEIPIKKRKIEQ